MLDNYHILKNITRIEYGYKFLLIPQLFSLLNPNKIKQSYQCNSMPIENNSLKKYQILTFITYEL